MESCRLCFVKDKLLDVFDSRFQNGGEVVRTYIQLFSGVEILASDIVTKKICQQCLDQILYMFNFRTRAGLNDRKHKKDAGLEVEKMKPIPVIIKNNFDMIKKISNTIIKMEGVPDIIIVDDEDSEIHSAPVPIEDLHPIQVNYNITNDQAQELPAIVASTSTTNDKEMITNASDKIQSIIEPRDETISNGELGVVSTSSQNNGLSDTGTEENSNNDLSKDNALTLQSNNICYDEIGESQVNDSSVPESIGQLNDEVSQLQLGTSICDESSPQKIDSICDDNKTKNVVCKSKKINNTKRKSSKSSDASNPKQLNISVSDSNKTNNTDKSSKMMNSSIADGQETKNVGASHANNSKNDDAITPNKRKVVISDGKKPNCTDKNGSKQMDISLSGGKKTKSVSKDAKGNKQQDTSVKSTKCDSDQNKTIDSCDKRIEYSKNKKREALREWVPSESVNNILKKYPKLIISEDMLDLNINPTIRLRRCDEKSTKRNARKRVNNSPVALTRARKRLRGSLPAELPFKRLEANSHINNMDEKKEMFVSSLELVSKDKINDGAEDIVESKLYTCIKCSENFKSSNSLKIHRRHQYCKWCKKCIQCSTVKHKHESLECKFKKKLVVQIEKMCDDDQTRIPSKPTEPQKGIDIDVEIALKEYILNKMTITKEKIIQTETLNTAPEQPIVEGTKIRYKDLYRDIGSSYMPVHLCLSTKNKSKIIRTNLEPYVSVKQPVTEVKKSKYEKKTLQQINDILFHNSKSPRSKQQSSNSSSNKSAVSVAEQPLPYVVNNQQQMNTVVNNQLVNRSAGNQQNTIFINNQKINVTVNKPAENKQLTAVINKPNVNLPVYKLIQNQQLTALINNQPKHNLPVRPVVNQQITIPINSNQINLPSIRPAVNQQITIPLNNQQINFRPAVSQHIAIPVNNIVVSQNLTIPVSNSALSLAYTNPGLNALLSMPYNATVASRQNLTSGLQGVNASNTVVSLNNMQTANAGFREIYTKSGPNILNTKIAQTNNMLQTQHLSIKVTKNETASTSSRKTASTVSAASHKTDVVNSRTAGTIKTSYIVTNTVQSPSKKIYRQTEKKTPIEHTQTKDTNRENSNDNPVILNGSRSVTNKIWVKNPMEINKSANI
ncbi:PREDICTED: uncharacterized protein LOC108565701 [Nicrophorus vespilloides]|uniref:Uncharacterized protein LOC108565701 n=1 Tax=Nicrophorus vespilloides TaxID=110193 RepID=A0ABM1N1T1_NICVS|nr:PREDICTED: uncharacterized protein LOC108565701 [Nicrophorus vespilloides]XP_017780781.1 PREDICTED: uncharacterized protein LOC108565701 [Nicrophorus vespilloides]